jgi:phenylacetate-CoA ligase
LNLRRLIYRLGVARRNPKVFKNYDFLIQSQYWSLEQLRAYQLGLLQGLIAHAYQNTDYYRRALDEHGVDPADIRTLDDVVRIPYLTKEQLLANVNRIQLTRYPDKLVYSETSGSTGKPLVFYRNLDWDAWVRASAFRGYSWYDVQPWERNGYLWGYNFSARKRLKTRILDALQNRFRLFSYDDREVDAFIRKLETARFLGGYSSMVYEVAKRINQMDPKPTFRLKMVKGTSEKIFAKYQEEAERAFGRRITSEYGAAETGIIAFECPQGNMHINMETALVEEDNHEIVVTNLVSRSFPIIRYRLGDYVQLDRQARCRCGRQHPLILEVTGRVGKRIYGRGKEYPSLTLYYVFKNLAMDRQIVLNYQAIQRSKGALDLKVEGLLGDRERSMLVREFAKYFADDIELHIEDRIDLRSPDRKKRDFISEIDPM